jgi:hypothetical protein
MCVYCIRAKELPCVNTARDLSMGGCVWIWRTTRPSVMKRVQTWMRAFIFLFSFAPICLFVFRSAYFLGGSSRGVTCGTP